MNLTLTERDKKLLGLTACLAILAVFGVHLIRPALAEHEALGGEYEAALQKQQEYQAQIDARAALDDSIAQNEAALKTVGEPYCSTSPGRGRARDARRATKSRTASGRTGRSGYAPETGG